jgi:predicted MFS family arabinose efflux permease
VPPARASNAIATVVFAGTIGSVLGPFFNTPAQAFATQAGVNPLAGPYFLAAVLAAVALAITFIMLRPDPSTLSRHREAQMPVNDQVKKSLRELFSSPTVQLAVVALAISQLVMTMIMIVTPLHMTHLHHSTRAIEWVIAVHILGMFALSNVTGKLVVRFGAFFMIAMAGIVLGAAAILAPLAQNEWTLGAALFLLGLGWNFGFVSGSALLANSFSGPDKGQAQGASETFVAAASAAGSFAIGPSFAWGGYVAVSMLGLAFVLAMMGALFWQRRSASSVPLS